MNVYDTLLKASYPMEIEQIVEGDISGFPLGITMELHEYPGVKYKIYAIERIDDHSIKWKAQKVMTTARIITGTIHEVEK